MQHVTQLAAGQGNGAGGSAVRPFEAQLAAARDRRSIGLYDARFHSTNWCVSELTCAGVMSYTSSNGASCDHGLVLVHVSRLKP